MPTHAATLSVLAAVGPMAAVSQGTDVARSLEGADGGFAAAAAVRLDGGRQAEPLSTVVDVRSEQPRLLRLGAVGVSRLRELAPGLVPDGTVGHETP